MKGLKQVLPWKGTTLLGQVLEHAGNADVTDCYLVLGHEAERIRSSIDPGRFSYVHNSNWNEGLASSIRGVIEHISKTEKPYDALLIALGDQPLFHTGYYNQLIRTYIKKASPIVATAYGIHAGVPALFDRRYFQDLASLQGDQGAKGILKGQRENVVTIPGGEHHFDIDTRADYEVLYKSHGMP
jgi:molybdenum cofactor cytidylyltransferase